VCTALARQGLGLWGWTGEGGMGFVYMHDAVIGGPCGGVWQGVWQDECQVRMFVCSVSCTVAPVDVSCESLKVTSCR
jgi:hypothetical protein